jgi:hypothetical protein
MNCTRYRRWVKRSELNSLGAPRQAKLDAHLARCDGCRELLDRERQLAETINLALTASVAAAPSADFAARVRVRLAEESKRARPQLAWVHRGWIPVSFAGIVALAMFLAVVWPAWRHWKQRQPVKQVARRSAPTTPAPVASLSPAATGYGAAVVASGAAHARVRSATARFERAETNRSTRTEDDVPQFQVMLEPGQSRAILAAYRAAQTAHVDADALAQTSDGDEQLEKIKPIEIIPVVVAELYPEEPTKPAGN